ncbi:hypothetical protein AAC387_Pa09g1554 [Persea americana]
MQIDAPALFLLSKAVSLAEHSIHTLSFARVRTTRYNACNHKSVLSSFFSSSLTLEIRKLCNCFGDNMSGRKIPTLSLPLISGGFGANAVVLDQSRDSSIPPMMIKQGNGDRFIAKPIASHRNPWDIVSANRVNFLSAWQGLHRAAPAGDVPKGIVLATACSESGKQPVDRHSVNMLKDDESWDLTQNLDSKKQPMDERRCAVSQPQSVVKVAMPSFSFNPGCRESKALSAQKRKTRISKGVKALGELVPNAIEDGKGAVLDDVIDHIKFLKLQLKALCQSRLGGEAISDPILYLEGYGHYIFHEQLIGDPLEEIIGELMETDMAAATELLNSKGLSIIPMDLANDLIQFD